MWGLPQITNPSPQLLIQAPDSGAKAVDSLCQAPDCLSKVQIPDPSPRFWEDFSKNSEQSPNIAEHAPSSLEPSGSKMLSGAKCGVRVGGGPNPPLTPQGDPLGTSQLSPGERGFAILLCLILKTSVKRAWFKMAKHPSKIKVVGDHRNRRRRP